MGRMLEALKSNDEATSPDDVVLTAVPAATDEEPALEMPFVEVGGPRPAAAARPQLERVAPRAAVLEPTPLRGVTLQPTSTPRPLAGKVAAELIAFHQPEHAVSQQYAALFGQLVAEPATEPAPVLLFTSLAPGAGTTTALLNLAITGAGRHQRRIVVVDANRARPAVAQRLGLAPSAGLTEVVQGKAALEQTVQATIQPELYVLPAGAGEQDLWSADAVHWALDWLRERFDLIVVDAPPWDTADLPSLVPAVDTVYLVLDAAEAAQTQQVRAVTRAIAHMGSRLGGLIVTQ
jgi:Mrp family chromosome partitioning ATPase